MPFNTFYQAFFDKGNYQPYVLFESDTGQGSMFFCLKTGLTEGVGNPGWDGNMYYSQDGVNWTLWDGSPIYASNTYSSKYQLYIRGEGNTVVTGSDNTDHCWQVWYDGYDAEYPRMKITGNIMNLLDWQSVQAGIEPYMAPYCFSYLFYKNHFYGLNDRCLPKLPALSLSSYCYSNMFYACEFEQVSEIIVLPATVAAQSCYRGMFSYCTGLYYAPELPATTLASYCYAYMFDHCTSLRRAPELPAATLATYCYQSMFENCTNLTAPPVLSSTNLAPYCYQYMFAYCDHLQSAPALPATRLQTYCYAYMFMNCTVLTTPPALPATTLQRSCYRGMFSYCTSLIAIPAIPSRPGVQRCYSQMYWHCSQLVFSTDPSAGTYYYTGEAANAYNTDIFGYTDGGNFGNTVQGTDYYATVPLVS